jgi:hypothetical protein
MAAVAEARIIPIGDGLLAQVVNRSILPRRLDALLADLRLVRSRSARVVGTRRACTEGDHDLDPWRVGVWRERELRLSLCGYCGAIEVRDVSLDILPDVKVGRGGPRRRSDVLGWYSGKRAAGRTYTGMSAGQSLVSQAHSSMRVRP